MDLTVLDGLGPARSDKLADAGVEDVHSLAESDLDTLGEQVDIPAGMLEGFQEQARALVELSELPGLEQDELEALVDAGVLSRGDLEAADPGELAGETGLEVARIDALRAGRAEGALADEASAAAKAAADRAREELEEIRVVLEEGIHDARVKLEGDVLAEARILPVKAKDNVDQLLEDVQGNVVVLREKADTALVRVEDEVYRNVPLFKAKLEEVRDQVAEEAEEVRVRVQEVRDKRVIPKAETLTAKIKSLFGRDE